MCHELIATERRAVRARPYKLPMLKTIESAPGVGEQMGDALDGLHKTLVVLKLTAYAADAMRVLNALQQQADRCQSFDQAMKSVCVDWRNPGSVDDPADLISEALAQASAAMAQILNRPSALSALTT